MFPASSVATYWAMDFYWGTWFDLALPRNQHDTRYLRTEAPEFGWPGHIHRHLGAIHLHDFPTSVLLR